MASSDRVTFTTPDGVSLAGIYRAAASPRGLVLLVHMMPATKESWGHFAERLAERGWSSLAFDLRGHGESVRQGHQLLDYRAFSDDEHRASSADLETAAVWAWSETGFDPSHLRLAGASIGANLALDFAARHPEVSRVLALSPGLNYHGATPEVGFSSYRPGQHLRLAASEEDAYAYSSVLELARVPTAAEISVQKLQGAGHGTAMLERDPAFLKESVNWLCVVS
jgi:alpha-beta hydrolase superfamily lysophospholipase